MLAIPPTEYAPIPIASKLAPTNSSRTLPGCDVGPIRIRNNAIDRTDNHALRLVGEAHALGAFAGVDHMNIIALRYGVVAAFELAHLTVDAVAGDQQSHIKLPFQSEHSD